MKLIKLLANLGYGSRKEVERFIKKGAVTDLDGNPISDASNVPHDQILYRDEPLDPESPLTIILNKPDGYTCSADDPGSTIYDLLPERFAHRNPGLNPIGRLDKDTTGMLLMTDDGKLLHKIIHPKSGCLKVYRATLDRPLEGHEAAIFASGEMMLNSEAKPLLPAKLEVVGEKEALVTLHEGRYHQIRRMFAAVGNHVTELKRISIGGLKLPEDLEEGDWRVLSGEDHDNLFT
ncbi:MAG TPA: pseudouridine synthase [Luteolibacter sp.]|nr:pseudouridine synthase [Luteolibacter sp.]